MEKEKYILSINIEGKDIQVEVPNLETAYLLLNDHEAARKYAMELNQKNQLGPTEQHDSISGPSTSTAGICKSTENESNSEVIWTKKRPSEKDLEATSLLLCLRANKKAKFDDKKTSKSRLWQEIAEIMQNNFNLGENGPERCRQKFANLTKSYLSYIKNQKTTGTGRDEDIPPFFDEVHSILGSKDKSNPKYLEDSFSEKSDEANSELMVVDKAEKENESSLEEKHSRDRFKNIRSKIKPNSKSDDVLKELKEDRVCREKQFSSITTHLKRSEEQRERLLNILERAFSKRKREESDDSD